MKANRYNIVASVGYGKTALNSLDSALINASIGNYNLVKVSSILPADATFLEHVNILDGSILFAAFCSVSSNKEGDELSAAVAIGLPANKSNVGVIMEYATKENCEQTEQTIRNMVREAMVARNYEIDSIVVKVASVTVGKQKDYVTAFAAVPMWEAK